MANDQATYALVALSLIHICGEDFSGKTVELTADIDLGGEGS